MKKFTTVLIALITVGGLLQQTLAAPPPGTTTSPYTVSYSARLTDTSGVPVATTQDIRFSLWDNADFTASDLLGSGAIDPSAPGYTGWTETYSVTPDSNGLFQVRLGSITTLPNFNSSTDVYLQVDVKPSGSPDTSYEVLDPDGNTANTTDRFPLDASAFAINADTLDNHDACTSISTCAPGDVPFLDGSGQLPISTIPGGTNNDTFIIDNDNSVVGPGSVSLQFGNTLNKFLEYDTAAGWFNFNDNVNVTGDLTTTGTINGVTIDNTTVGPYDQSIVYEPEYADGVIQPDGTSNKGTLKDYFADTDGAPGNNNINYYEWTTNQTSLQNMDIVIRTTLPSGFVSWQATPVQFTYRTGTASTADNQVDISIEDTDGNSVTLTGATGLVSTTFATSDITFGGSPAFAAGEPITIHVKMTAKDTGFADAARLQLNYNGR